MPHKGTYSRGYLPHRDYPDSVQAITFRLADAVPKSVITGWRAELAELLESPDTTEAADGISRLHRRIARYEDAGHGSCLLSDPKAAETVQQRLIADHPERYRLIDWCVMPNHVHILIRVMEGHPLGQVIHRWKGSSSYAINRLYGRSGKFWALDFFDRYIRDEDHLQRSIHYIRNNPVKAGLCTAPEAWPHSSAGIRWTP